MTKSNSIFIGKKNKPPAQSIHGRKLYRGIIFAVSIDSVVQTPNYR